MTFGDGQLLGGHVDPDDLARLSNEPRQQVDIAPGAAAQVEHPQSLKQIRRHQAAPVVTAADLRVDVREQGPQMRRGGVRGTAGGGAQVRRAAKDLPIVVLDVVVDGIGGAHDNRSSFSVGSGGGLAQTDGQ